MKQTERKATKVIGMAVKTINAPEHAGIDIPALWEKFMSSNLSDQLPNRMTDDIYCVYCKYEGDHTAPYTTLIGHEVPINEPLKKGLVEIQIPASKYAVFKAEGDLTGGAVFETWTKIWQTDLDRTYSADFEIYGKDATNPQNGKIDIFVGIK